MKRGAAVFSLILAGFGLILLIILRVGLPMRALPLPNGNLIGAVNNFATDPSRHELFSNAEHRIVPFQMLYPASTPGTYAPYLPDAGPQIDAFTRMHGWMFQGLIGQIGALAAPWTDMATPAAGGPYPVIIYLPGVTGYMQMGSFQTIALAAQGYIVVTLNQPGVVTAAVMPDQQIVVGLTRAEAVSVVAPSYRENRPPMPIRFSEELAPEGSIVPYFAIDVPLVIDRLAQINADPGHIMHGLLDLDHVGVMGMSLGAIVTAQACANDARIDACLMMDAPVPMGVAATGLRQAALWISRPKEDQRLEREASGGWPEDEIAAQANTIAQAISNSKQAQEVQLQGLFHIDFTDLPAIQPIIGWLGQSGPVGIGAAHRHINELTFAFFVQTLGPVRIISNRS